MKLIYGLLSASLLASAVVSADTAKIAFPGEYKSTFTNYLSLDRTLNADQTIRLFANETAMQGADADGKLPYGSVLVAEIYKAKKDADGNVIVSSLDRRLRGDFALIAVMERREGFNEGIPAALQNDDWDFATFTPAGEPAKKDLNTCRACHAPLTSSNHLFSYDHLK